MSRETVKGRHAYLVMAHNEPEILAILLKMLDDKRNDIYLHIDRRALEMRRHFQGWRQLHSGFFMIDEPEAVYWGDISQVRTELKLFEAAHRNGSYDYYHLLSGTCLPVKTQDHIHKFFSLNRGKEFVDYHISDFNRRDVNRKIRFYWLFTTHLRGKTKRTHLSVLRKLVYWLQFVSGFRRSRDIELFKGHNWVSVTEEFCTYLLQHKDEIFRRYRNTICADEIFIHTLLWHSPFRDNIYRLPDGSTSCMRAIDWQRGNPYVWQEEDYDDLTASPCCFARKFSSNHLAVAERLRDTLTHE